MASFFMPATWNNGILLSPHKFSLFIAAESRFHRYGILIFFAGAAFQPRYVAFIQPTALIYKCLKLYMLQGYISFKYGTGCFFKLVGYVGHENI